MPKEDNTMRWNFDNTYVRLSDKLFAPQAPIAVEKPETVLFNKVLAQDFGLDFLNDDSKAMSTYFSGTRLPDGAEPIAQAYAGHQFGHFTMLGDGRAVLLGELVNTSGERFDLQLKGSGRTPFSRGGDGRATLKSMLREYLISEAMHHLEIPTTRSLAVVKTGEKVFRPEGNEGAVLTRIASSHIRVGTFEYVKKFCGNDELKAFTDYVIKRHYPQLIDTANPPLELIKSVMYRQVDLIVDWMRVGFIHGVMNTDNMSIAGETIDYGPCAFMNAYKPLTAFSSVDTQGRYAFENQPYIANWNLAIFGSTLLPLIDDDQKKAIEQAQNLLDGMKDIYIERFYQMMFGKLGLLESSESNKTIVNQLLQWMEQSKVDYTDTFSNLNQNGSDLSDAYQGERFKNWLNQWRESIQKQGDTSRSADLMKKSNPVVIPRNHLVEDALTSAAQGDMTLFDNLLGRLKTPYEESARDQKYKTVPQGFDEHYQTFCGT